VVTVCGTVIQSPKERLGDHAGFKRISLTVQRPDFPILVPQSVRGLAGFPGCHQ
jgi:hypothetical protein